MIRVGLRAGEAVWRTQTCGSHIRKSLETARRRIRSPQAPSSSVNGFENLRRYSALARWPASPCGGGNDKEISRHVFQCFAPAQSSRPSIQHLATTALRRHAHTRSKRRRVILPPSTRHKSTDSDGPKPVQATNTGAPRAELSPENKQPPPPADPSPKLPTDDPTAKPHSILDRLPHLPHLHRPTYEELLSAATGAWSRFKIHFKWFSIRSFRPWNVDDISAFFTWIIAGHIVWILVGTTTFFSLIIFMINTAFTQETLARWIGNYLTQSSGIHVIFESAVVPKWGDGVISFHNVFVSRRPGQGKKGQVKKGSQAEAAAAAAATEGRTFPSPAEAAEANAGSKDDGNYTQFDVSIDTVNVTLSFAKWFNGKGLLRDVEINGIRGVIDRTHVDNSAFVDIDPRTWKHTHQTGDFELESFKMEDMLVTVYQPDGFRPFSVSVHLCELPRLRKQWLFYDFLSANVVSGSFDNAMFAIHPRQEHNSTGSTRHGDAEESATQWKKHARFRIDGLAIDHLNRGMEGMFAWIKEGKVDIVSDMMFPSDNESLAKVMSDFYDRVEASVTNSARGLPVSAGAVLREGGFATALPGPTKKEVYDHIHDVNTPAEPIPLATPLEEAKEEKDADPRFLVMDMRVQLNDVRATVPFFTHDISYINNALIRPIVAYINARKAFIPVNCRLVKRMSDFDGSWTAYDSGLMGDLSQEVYKAFANDVLDDDQLRRRRFKKVGVWTLQLAAQALFIGLAGNIA